MKTFIKSFFAAALFVLASSSAMAAACTTDGSGNVTDSSGTCSISASSFAVTIYEIGLCSSALTLPTSSAAYSTSSCQVIYSNSSGSQITAGSSATALSGGTQTIPQAGTYNYGYVVFGNNISIAGTANFASSVTGGTALVHTFGSGTSCYTTAATLTASTLNASSPSNLPFACGGGTAGTATFTLDNLTVGTTTVNSHLNITSSTFSSLGSDTVDVYLLDNTNKLSTSVGASAKLLGIQTLATPVTIASSSSSLDVGFTKSTGLNVVISTVLGTKYAIVYPSIPNIKISGH